MNRSGEKIVLAALTGILVFGVLYTQVGFDRSTTTATASFMDGEEVLATVDLEVAETEKERSRGLMNRTELGENKGMLFVFPGEKERVFWMKNTYIPLDIIFVDSEMTVVDIDRANPQPDMSEEELEIYRSEEPAQYVIEVNQNFTKENSIEIGDRVILNR